MNETARALQAFHDYVDLGPRRSQAMLLEFYEGIAEEQGEDAVPTLSAATLSKWSSEHDWQDRLKPELERRMRDRQHSYQEALHGINEQLAGLIDEDIARLRKNLEEHEGESLAKSVNELAELAELAHQVLGGRALPKQVHHTHEAAGEGAGGIAIVPIFGSADPLGEADEDEDDDDKE